jgi:MFS family permease
LEHKNASVIIFLILYGFTSGFTFSIVPALIADILPDIRKLSLRISTLYAVSATRVLREAPFRAAGKGNRFLGLTLFSGTLLTIEAFFFVYRD